MQCAASKPLRECDALRNEVLRLWNHGSTTWKLTSWYDLYEERNFSCVTDLSAFSARADGSVNSSGFSTATTVLWNVLEYGDFHFGKGAEEANWIVLLEFVWTSLLAQHGLRFPYDNDEENLVVHAQHKSKTEAAYGLYLNASAPQALPWTDSVAWKLLCDRTLKYNRPPLRFSSSATHSTTVGESPSYLVWPSILRLRDALEAYADSHCDETTVEATPEHLMALERSIMLTLLLSFRVGADDNNNNANQDDQQVGDRRVLSRLVLHLLCTAEAHSRNGKKYSNTNNNGCCCCWDDVQRILSLVREKIDTILPEIFSIQSLLGWKRQVVVLQPRRRRRWGNQQATTVCREESLLAETLSSSDACAFSTAKDDDENDESCSPCSTSLMPLPLLFLQVSGPSYDYTRRRVTDEALRRVGFRAVMDLGLRGGPSLGPPMQMHHEWSEFLTTKNRLIWASQRFGKNDRWSALNKTQRLRYEYLRHYASVDRYFLRVSLYLASSIREGGPKGTLRATTFDVRDTIMSFVYGVFALPKNFVRKRFKRTESNRALKRGNER